MTEEKENTFDMKQLLLAFDQDNKATVQMVSKQLEEERLRNVKEGLKKKTTQQRKNTQPVRPLDTKKLFTQTTENLKKALEVEKKA